MRFFSFTLCEAINEVAAKSFIPLFLSKISIQNEKIRITDCFDGNTYGLDRL